MTRFDVLDAVRRPEYTGENRCLPCTGVNAVIAILAAAAVGVVVPLGAAGSAAFGGVALVAFAAAIYLRGFLVPGTPWLTKTYLPDWFLRYFEHGPAAGGLDAGGDPDAGAATGVEPATVLDRAGAVTECVDVDDLCLTDGFRSAWDAEIDRLRAADTSRADLAAVLELPERALEFEEHGDAFVAMADGGQLDGQQAFEGRRRVGQWESRGAFLADVAAASVLGERDPDWQRRSATDRGRVLNGLRIFLERCPTCGGDVELGEETVESCCRWRSVVAVSCGDCGDRLFEAERPPDA